MTLSFKDKAGKVLVVEGTTSLRNLMTDAIKTLGFGDVQGVPSLKEALDLMEVDPILWVVGSLSADQPVNMMHLLKICNEYPELKDTQFSLFSEVADHYCLPSAFANGLLSFHPKASSKDQLKDELKKFLDEFAATDWNATAFAANNLRRHLMAANLNDDLLAFDKSMVATYPDKVEYRFNIIEPLKRLDRKADLKSQLRIIRAIAPKEEKRCAELEKSLQLKDDLTPDKAENFLNINRVVVIEPDETVQRQLIDSLKLLGCESIMMFSDSQEAINHLEKEGNPDLIIQEWRLKPLSGSAVLQRLKTKLAINTPVIVMSSLIQPQDTPLLREMGVAHVESKPLDGERFISRIISVIHQDRSPTDISSIERKFRAALRQGDLTVAMELFATYEKTEKVSEGMKRTLEAELMFAQKVFDKSRDAAVEAIKISGDSLILLNVLGKCLLNLRDFASALKCFDKAREMSPHNVERLCAMADAQTELGNTTAAKATLEHAADIDTNSDKVKESKARVAMASGKFADASRILSELGSLDDVISYLNNQAVTLAKLGDFQTGMEKYHNAIESIPETHKHFKALVLYNLGLAAVKAKELGEAKDALEECVKFTDSKVFKKAQSLAKRVEKAISTGQEVVLNMSAGDATESGGKQPAAGALTEEAPAAESHNTQNRDARAAIGVRKGDRCCYMIFNPAVLSKEAAALSEKGPRFNFRAAITRAEAQLDRVKPAS